MVHFPVLQSLTVDRYMLYPGLPDAPGLNVEFTPGPRIVIGVNGLGKSTLLLLLRHVLTGPVKARSAGFTGERSDIQGIDPSFFAYRVIDGAKAATSNLTARFGPALLSVTRRLSDLSLVEASLEMQEGLQLAATEADYRALVTSAMGVASFNDALRVIDRVSFFLEAREPLIWDVAAQFELFRAILSPENSDELRSLESTIVSADSAARNLNATIYTISKRREKQLQRHSQSAEIHAQLAIVTAKVAEAETEEARLQRQLDICDERRADARTELKRAERLADEAARKYETVKYEALRHAFAGVPPTDQYVFLKIITERVCIACSNPADATADKLERRRLEDCCLVCGSPRHKSDAVVSTAVALQERAQAAYQTLMAAREEHEKLGQRFSIAERDFAAADQQLEDGRIAVDAARREARRLRSKLPSVGQSDLARDEDQLTSLRQEVWHFRREREEAEEKIGALISELSSAAEAIRGELESHFQAIADEFFAEKVRLVYAPRKDRIGQTGRIFEFPAFEVEMTSGATQSQFIRRRADQVSLSQREYLDTIFRISIIETLGTSGGSFVVDGPEGSLDAVFAGRAGNLFARLPAAAADHRVIMACNVVEGQFIPNTLRDYHTPDARRARLINLIDLGAPTSALTELKTNYQTAIDDILSQPAR